MTLVASSMTLSTGLGLTHASSAFYWRTVISPDCYIRRTRWFMPPRARTNSFWMPLGPRHPLKVAVRHRSTFHKNLRTWSGLRKWIKMVSILDILVYIYTLYLHICMCVCIVNVGGMKIARCSSQPNRAFFKISGLSLLPIYAKKEMK